MVQRRWHFCLNNEYIHVSFGRLILVDQSSFRFPFSVQCAGRLYVTWRRSRMNTTGKLASIIMGRSQDKEDKEGDREMNAYKVLNPYFPFSCLFLSLINKC